ncbi:LysR substrate-binding domain-containing protein [Cupriavidus sp. AU9028]|uniref:LysR substrate-binding domain-containing protein n=1 Tax=Cupriavidus sp. AU9028 TaxID=2871157 RepID=UPI001C96016E|nr:LysR substrate-binding domain-containing protein [Cupriavidus sp. AU9028]MBY4896916.1 LysR family transcriptional regulator [Cupriavidus sp. AU9028]
MRYDLTDLRLFLNVGETQNLTRAAERSFLSLPAASTRIKQLEEAFQTQLLIRQVKGVRLTPAGEALLLHAREVFRELECLHADLRPYAQGVKGKVRLLANTTATNSFLATALSRFLSENPDIDVELEEHLSQEIVSAISAGAADLGIVAGGVATQDLDAMQLCSDELIVIAPVNHPLPEFKRLHFAELVDTCRFVGLNQFSAIQSFLDRIASGMGKRISLRIQVGSFDAVCRMVEAGAGIAIVPNSCARRYASRKVLRFIRLEDDWARRDLQLVRRPGRELPKFAETLVEYLTVAAREPV